VSDGTIVFKVTPVDAPGPVVVKFAFDGDATHSAAQVSATIELARAKSRVAAIGLATLPRGYSHPLRMTLRTEDGRAIANRVVTFLLGGATRASAVTDANGEAAATVTIPATEATGPLSREVRFEGDTYYAPSSESGTTMLYEPTSFVVWGGNPVALAMGQRVQFFGHGWWQQVTGGDYKAAADFAGWSVAPLPASLCQQNARTTGTPLLADGCWSAKPGQGDAPRAVAKHIGVVVATSIEKARGAVYGNTAALVVLETDAGYSNSLSRSSFGIVRAIIDNGNNVVRATEEHSPSTASASAKPHSSATERFPGTVFSLLSRRARTFLSLSVSADYISPEPTINSIATNGITVGDKRYSLYSPELNLIAETEVSSSATPAIAHQYLWFAGAPVAQVDVATNTIAYTFTDHLGTPLTQTDTNGTIIWRAEHEPYGNAFTLRAGSGRHQPLRFPGQEAEQVDDTQMNGATERSYNIFRWYRSAWGRYTQTDPLGQNGDPNPFAYAATNPMSAVDPFGLRAEFVCAPITIGTLGVPIGLHCRLRVTCERNCEGGRFGGPYDTSVGLERPAPARLLRITEYPIDANYGRRYPVWGVNQQDSCDFGRCVRAYNELLRRRAPEAGWDAQYSILGPNSNTYIGFLTQLCGGVPPAPFFAPGPNGPMFE
jgi:RHS repeat-associated protein